MLLRQITPHTRNELLKALFLFLYRQISLAAVLAVSAVAWGQEGCISHEDGPRGFVLTWPMTKGSVERLDMVS